MSPIDTQAIATQPQSLTLSELYDVDDHLWLEENIKLLKAGNFSALDLEHLIEELEDLSNRDRTKARSLLEQIIRHLLMLNYWDRELERNSAHWQAELFSFRNQLRDHLTATLRNHLEAQLEIIYVRAVGYVSRKSQDKTQPMPNHCPYSLEQLLDVNFL